MSIPKKGSRAIEVDGVAYRWRIRRRPTAQQARGRSPLILAVAVETGNGPALIVRLDRCHPKNKVGRWSTAVTPRDVAFCIRDGLAAGWEPHQPGRTFEHNACLHHEEHAGTRIYPPGLRPPTRAEIVELAHQRSHFDTLELKAEARLSWPGAETRSCGLCINGRDLIEHVRETELPHVELEIAERRDAGEDVREAKNFAGEYLGVGLHQYRLPSRRLFGPMPDAVHGFVVAPDDPQLGKTMLLSCTCGITECWFLLVTITVLEDFVVWTDFEQFHRHWVYDLGPFVFTKQAYLAALAPI